MTRGYRRGFAICALLFAISAAGCGSGPATPAQSLLSDPSAIVTRSLARLEDSTALHINGTISGSVDADTVGALVGGGSVGLSGKIKLDGASLSGDVDMTHQALHLSVSFPSLFGSSAELILVDGYAYTKVTTPVSSSDEKYTKSKVATSLLMPSAAPEATVSFLDILRQLELRLGPVASTALLVGQDTVDGRAAYHLVVNVPADLVNQALEAAGGPSAGIMSFDVAPVDYWVYVDSLQPAGLQLKVSSPTIGNAVIALTLTRYDQVVAIQAPPDSQVGAG